MPRLPNPQLAQQWQQRLQRFEQSELTVAQFCRREGYSVASFYLWRRKLRDRSGADRSAVFVPVGLPPGIEKAPHHGDLQIELPGGAFVRLHHDADDQQRCRLIKNIVDALSEVAS